MWRVLRIHNLIYDLDLQRVIQHRNLEAACHIMDARGSPVEHSEHHHILKETENLNLIDCDLHLDNRNQNFLINTLLSTHLYRSVCPAYHCLAAEGPACMSESVPLCQMMLQDTKL